jgi:DNA-3-methyladenine glycosylase I
LSWYCDVAPGDDVHRPYHDHEYGFPCRDERALCERLALEVFQAGLSWRLILQRRAGLAAALADFIPDRLAHLTQAEVTLLLGDPRLIRNRRKLNAVIANAEAIVSLRSSHGGFAAWLAAHHPRNEKDWVALFRQTFRFMGPEVVREFLVSIGYLPGAHRPECPIYQRIVAASPPWLPPNHVY